MIYYSGFLYINNNPWPVHLDDDNLYKLRNFAKEYAQEYCDAKKGDIIELKKVEMYEDKYKRLKKIKMKL